MQVRKLKYSFISQGEGDSLESFGGRGLSERLLGLHTSHGRNLAHRTYS